MVDILELELPRMDQLNSPPNFFSMNVIFYLNRYIRTILTNNSNEQVSQQTKHTTTIETKCERGNALPTPNPTHPIALPHVLHALRPITHDNYICPRSDAQLVGAAISAFRPIICQRTQ